MLKGTATATLIREKSGCRGQRKAVAGVEVGDGFPETRPVIRKAEMRLSPHQVKKVLARGVTIAAAIEADYLTRQP